MNGLTLTAQRRAIFQLLFLGLGLSIALDVRAGNVKVAWDASVPPPKGYKIYYTAPGEAHPKVSDVGNITSGSISNLLPGLTYEIYATAYDGNNESGPSNKITYTVPQPATLVANDDNFIRSVGQTLALPTRILTANDVSSTASALDVARALGPSARGFPVILAGSNILYLPSLAMTNADSFGYVVNDRMGNSVTGRVNIAFSNVSGPSGTQNANGTQTANPTLTLSLADKATVHLNNATPNTDYRVQATTQLKELPWEDIGTVRTDLDGHAQQDDNVATASPARFYRTVTP